LPIHCISGILVVIQPDMKPKYTQILYPIFILILFCTLVGISSFSYSTLQEVQKLSKVTLQGVVANPSGVAVVGVRVVVGDSSSKTDVSGGYQIQDLKWGWHKLSVEVDDYLPFQKDIYLPFGNAAYQKIDLEVIDYARLRGYLVSDDTAAFEKNKSDMVFKVNSTVVQLQPDSTFETDKISIQKVSIFIQVPGFEDYYKTITLKNGINNVGSIVLNKKLAIPNLEINDLFSKY
jgi:hypothetical protein